MAGKISTLILTVDLECSLCSKKIRKIVFKLQDREQIQTVEFDEKKHLVTISGPFDPQKMKKKLLCKAGKVIREVKIKEEEKKQPPPKETKPAEPEKPKPVPVQKEKEKPKAEEKPKEKEKEKPKTAEPEKAKAAEPEKVKTAEPEKAKPKPTPKEPEPEITKIVPIPEYQPYWPVGSVGPAMPTCCWRPCYVEYYGGCRCSSCGMFYEWTSGSAPPNGAYKGGPSNYHFFCEEDPSCSIM